MLVEATSEIAARITGAIRDAAKATGASFEYLLKTALRESNLDPKAKAATSSASGLFQFIDQTWLGTLKRAGPGLGYGKYADSIVQTRSGRYAVRDPARRQAIMNLRNDPKAAAAMGAAFTKRNAAVLNEKLGRPPSDGELYIAHFLGPSGAVKLISATAAGPDAKAAGLFPQAARANRSVFYDKAGAARSLAEVYGTLVHRHERTQIAALAAAPLVPAIAPPSSAATAAPATSGAAAATPPVEPFLPMTPSSYAAEPRQVFHGLFRTDDRAPVSAIVSELWGAKDLRFPVDHGGAAVRVMPAAAADHATGAERGPLDLMRFLRPGTAGRTEPPA